MHPFLVSKSKTLLLVSNPLCFLKGLTPKCPDKKKYTEKLTRLVCLDP
jgi:hypothetical protein